jgi:hypothetical protein
VVARPRWRSGWDDLVPLAILAAPMLAWAFLGGADRAAELTLVVAAVAVATVLKHILREGLADLALVPPVIALLFELYPLGLTVERLFLAAAAGIGLLLWAGAEPMSGIPVGRQLEPAVVPALAVGVAVAVMLFLPNGSGGQVGLAALVLVAVLGLSAWLYVRSAIEAATPQPTP